MCIQLWEDYALSDVEPHKMMGAVAVRYQQGELSVSHWNDSVIGAWDCRLRVPAVLRCLGRYLGFAFSIGGPHAFKADVRSA